MDRGKRPTKFVSNRNNKIYMDLKDIMREHTLAFLPAKSLFRFQAVCRDWKLQISSPFFAHNQSLSCQDISGVFCQSPWNPPSFISLQPKSCGLPEPSLNFLPEPVIVRASSNGLVCCQGRTGVEAYYICNPVTKHWKKLPKENANHGHNPAVAFVFEPSLLKFVADYKLVCGFPSNDFDDATEFEIYSSTEGSWKMSGEICFASKQLVTGSGVHANGVVYWKTKQGGYLSFDIAKDRSQLLEEYYGYNYGYNSTLGILNGKICEAYLSQRTIVVNALSNIHSNTMQMHSMARTWVEKIRFTLDIQELGMMGHEQGSVLFLGCNVLLVQYGKTIYLYDVKANETKVLCSAADYDIKLVGYVNSLVSL